MELFFASEQQIDQLAEKLGMDPVEFRLKNALIPGKSITPTQRRLREDAGAPADTIRRTAELIGWDKPLPNQLPQLLLKLLTRTIVWLQGHKGASNFSS